MANTNKFSEHITVVDENVALHLQVRAPTKNTKQHLADGMFKYIGANRHQFF